MSAAGRFFCALWALATVGAFVGALLSGSAGLVLGIVVLVLLSAGFLAVALVLDVEDEP